jgi:hypothetical protein
MTDNFYIECSIPAGMTARDYRFRNARARRPRWYALTRLLRSAQLCDVGHAPSSSPGRG